MKLDQLRLDAGEELVVAEGVKWMSTKGRLVARRLGPEYELVHRSDYMPDVRLAKGPLGVMEKRVDHFLERMSK